MVAVAAALMVHLVFWHRNKVPYVLTPPYLLDEITTNLDVQSGDIVVDLGCGDGRVLAAIYRAQPGVRLVGIDNNPMALLIAKLRLGPKVHLIRGDLASFDFAATRRVFCYLGPGLMQALEPQFAGRLAKGARVASLQFPLPTKKPTKVIRLPDAPPYAATLYLYDY